MGNVETLIGDNVFIHPTAEVDPSVMIGEGTKVWKFANILNGARIGKNCVIGSHVEIGKDVVIGDNCKVEAGAYLPEGVTLEDGVFIGPRACFTNDMYPPSSTRWKTLVKRNASIGANATIVCGITIGEGSLVGAGSVVTRDLQPGVVAVGNPATMKWLRK
jgi:UDP-2-acetamido-3-amino-2,3-dideoxy-glucuronate N-acetyltransferase